MFDGHGGEWAAEYVSTHLPETVSRESQYHSGSKSKDTALQKAFLRCDEQCLSEQAASGESSGTTAVAVLIDHNDIFVANCGDSRAILCRAGCAVELTQDHKPTDATEKARMESAGASVPDGSNYVEFGEQGLAVARAFGNPLFKANASKKADAQIIIPHPHQSRTARELGRDEFLVLATDGLWNVCTHQYVVDFVRKRLLQNLDAEDIAHKLTQHALDKKTNDNVTVCIVLFPVAFSPDLLAQVPIQVQVQPAAAANATSSSA